MPAELLVLMGSGETTPTMIKPHRSIFERVGERPAVLLDTPYGFQSNADDISARAVAYFAASIGRQIGVASWRRSDNPAVTRERTLADVRGAGWVFAGPGSPTYALRHWRGTPIPGLLAQVPVLVFASAAALTLGSHTIPVYEIYKAGEEPRWEPGLGLFEQLTGCPAVIVPHYDNAEGGHHDTRFCYLGEDRLARMERDLPSRAVIVGIDEHTGIIIDLRARTVAVVGNGNLTLRQGGESRIHPAGTTISLADLADAHHGGLPVTVSSVEMTEAHAEAPSLREAADDCEASFSTALAERDVDGCVAAVLALSQSLDDWAADTLASPDHDHALGVLRGMVVRLGQLAQGALVGVPALVEAVLDLRRQAREGRDFAAADRLRDALDRAGIEVRDTPTGPTWAMRP